MAADDYAILVGIGKYGDDSTFPELSGPSNDLALMRTWLLSANGGALPTDHIITIKSPASIDAFEDPDEVPPATEAFKRAFKKLITDKNGNPLKRQSRLYLYFAGHGFCERDSQTPQGALYAANATRLFPENIFGTYYAHSVKNKALFEEVVLIMDCCRDTPVNHSPDVPSIHKSGSSNATDVKLTCFYAAPKGGKAQEREIPERGNKVHGLLTHALIKSLEQMPPDQAGGVTSYQLGQHIRGIWAELCGDIPAEKPEVVPPAGDDLVFAVGDAGVVRGFRFSQAIGSPAEFVISDHLHKPMITCSLNPPPQASSCQVATETLPLSFDGERFELTLAPGLYQYTLSNGQTSADFLSVQSDGEADVLLRA